jgi:AcrR family transcriptional regulator
VEEKKEKTIEKAREYFHKYWYRKASLSDLIAEIGISKPTFYNYFKNKEALFNSVMLATYNEFQYEYNQRTKRATSAMEKLDLYIRTYQWFLEHFPLYKDLYIPGNDLMPRWLKSRYSKDIHAEGIETIRSILEQGQEERLFSEDLDISKAAVLVYNMITLQLSHDSNLFKKPNKPDFEADLDTLVQILGQGLLYRD